MHRAEKETHTNKAIRTPQTTTAFFSSYQPEKCLILHGRINIISTQCTINQTLKMPGSNYNNNTGEFPIFINEMKNIFAIPMAFYKKHERRNL